MRVSGNVPADPRLAQMLVESRFFDFVTTGEQKPKSTGTGEILSRQSDKVDSEGSYMVLQQIDATIPGDVFTWDGIQRLIVEAMTNTENHARGTARGRERWWLSVHCDRNDGVARFCFFDNGIGIFESLRKKGFSTGSCNSLGIVTECPCCGISFKERCPQVRVLVTGVKACRRSLKPTRGNSFSGS